MTLCKVNFNEIRRKNTIKIVVLVIKLCISHCILTLKYLNLTNGNPAYKQSCILGTWLPVENVSKFLVNFFFVNFIIKTTVNDK